MTKQKGGKPLILQPANYTGSPIGSDKILTGRGCSGTTSNIDAAAGNFTQQNGGYGFGNSIGDIVGPYSGHPEVISDPTYVPVNNPQSMGAGVSKTIKETIASMPGNQSGGRRSRSNKRVVKRAKKNSRRTKKIGKRHKKGGKRSRKTNGRVRKVGKRTHKNKKGYKHRGGAPQSYSTSLGYNLGGELSPNESALANPPLFNRYNNCSKA
jgi:hypothetical protein